VNRVRRIEIARRIWEVAKDARGTPVATYLAGRGISLAAPSSLRWAPRCWHPSGTFLPAMIARIDNIDGELIGIHRTFLRPDGSGKADLEPQKAMLGRAAGGAVRLAPAAETLLVGEGIETSLAAMQATARPAWAALSAPGVKRLILPRDARDVVIAVDRDHSGTGERSARAAAQRWVSEGRRVRLIIPNRIGADINDLLREALHAA
jgi:putative DNA primase/helicase